MNQSEFVGIELSQFDGSEVNVPELVGSLCETHQFTDYSDYANDVSKRAQEILRKIAPLSLSDQEWEIILEDAEDWE